MRRNWRDLNTTNTKDMWEVVHNVMGYKSRSAPIMCEATLPDELNTFYAHFDLLNKESAVKFTPPPEDSVSIHRGCEKNPADSEHV